MVERGKTGGFDESRLRDKVEVLGPAIRLSELEASIRARLIEELGVTWDERYGQLIAYKERQGNCNVPIGWPENPSFASWCHKQREYYKNGVLSPERIKRLDDLGFVWDYLAAAWEEMFAELLAYKQTHDNCDVPTKWKENPRLGTWCSLQRRAYKKAKLSSDRIARLASLGFQWDLFEIAWEEMFAALVAYKRVHNDCNVPQGWRENPSLALWCANQRKSYKEKILSSDQVKRLEEIGFQWGPYEVAWEQMFAALADYRKTHGDCNVPFKWKDNPSLASWCYTQRDSFKKGLLSPKRTARLEDIGFQWAPFDVAWESMFRALADYRKIHGDCNVPIGWPEDPSFARWCHGQRAAYRRKSLSPDRIKKLDDLGFVWDYLAAAWEEMFAELLAYKQTHGDCNVPFKRDPLLGQWCLTQRRYYKDSTLAPARIKRLEDIGFQWNPIEDAWEQMFAALADYRKIHGDCNVPFEWRNNPSLARWCYTQRGSYKKGLLSPERIKRLEDLGFVWDSLVAAWEEMFAALAAYRDNHGNCSVPFKWKDNPSLANWCFTQRTSFKNGLLSPDRATRLEEIGFQWNPFDVAWEEMFAALVAYKHAHGGCTAPIKGNAKLGRWCQTQRQCYKDSTLAPARIKRLEDIGFQWNPVEGAWEEMFAALVAYKHAHGGSTAPIKGNSKLGQWCLTQRQNHKDSTLAPALIKRLEDIGFQWDPFAIAWEEMFAELGAYKQTHGAPNVPTRWKDNPKLGSWCGTQRQAYKNAALSDDRVKRLEEIGFSFDVRQAKKE